MTNTCVMCGDTTELPEGTDVCLRCQRGDYATGVICPNCGKILRIMNTSNYKTLDGFGFSTVYHCDVCNIDWEKESEYTAKPVVFKRKYWG